MHEARSGRMHHTMVHIVRRTNGNYIVDWKSSDVLVIEIIREYVYKWNSLDDKWKTEFLAGNALKVFAKDARFPCMVRPKSKVVFYDTRYSSSRPPKSRKVYVGSLFSISKRGAFVYAWGAMKIRIPIRGPISRILFVIDIGEREVRPPRANFISSRLNSKIATILRFFDGRECSSSFVNRSHYPPSSSRVIYSAKVY